MHHSQPPLWTLTALVILILTSCMPGAASTPEVPLTSSPFPPSTLSPTPSVNTPLPPTLTPPPLPVLIEDIEMMDTATGWGIGRIGADQATRLLRTTDGGATWQDISPGTQSYEGLSFLDAQHAWVRSLDNRELWRTQDGGQSWSSLGKIAGSEFWFNDPQHGWKMEAEAWGLSYVQFDILSFSTTQDGGGAWQDASLPPGNGLAFLAYPDPQTAWAVRAGFAKTIGGFPDLAVPFSLAITSDGGKTWRSKKMPLPPGVKTVKMMQDGGSYLDAGNCNFSSPVYSSTTVWKLALLCEKQGWLYTSTDQGKSWAIRSLPTGQVTGVQFIDPMLGWSLRRETYDSYESQLYGTTDGGETWTLLASAPWADARLDFVDEQSGWAVVRTCSDPTCNPYLYPSALQKTIDGGKTWQSLTPQLLP